MFQSLYFKEQADMITDNCVDERYGSGGANDKSIGKMFYLKQLSKAADDLYNRLRSKIEAPDSIVDKKVVASDKFFSVTAAGRQGSSKIDYDQMVKAVVVLLKAQVDPETGTELWSDFEAQVRAAKIVQHCTVIGKGTTVISVIENQPV